MSGLKISLHLPISDDDRVSVWYTPTDYRRNSDDDRVSVWYTPTDYRRNSDDDRVSVWYTPTDYRRNSDDDRVSVWYTPTDYRRNSADDWVSVLYTPTDYRRNTRTEKLARRAHCVIHGNCRGREAFHVGASTNMAASERVAIFLIRNFSVPVA